MRLGKSTATVTPQQAKDNRGGPTGPAPVSHAVPGCLYAPGDSDENHDRATSVVTTATVYAPLGHSFPTGATVDIEGFVGLVVGLPDRWGTSGQAVHLRRASG